MSLVDKPANGVKLVGLDPREDSTALADAFGIEDGDIISSVDGIALNSEDALAAALDHLSTKPTPVKFTVSRIASGRKVDVDFEIRRVD